MHPHVPPGTAVILGAEGAHHRTGRRPVLGICGCITGTPREQRLAGHRIGLRNTQ